MRCVGRATVVLLVILRACLNAHGASVSRLTDLIGTNRLLSSLGGEEKCTTNDDCEKSSNCATLVHGIEMFCMRSCDVDSDCEKHMFCSKGNFLQICLFKECQVDDNCEYPSICYNLPVQTNGATKKACVRLCDCGINGTCRYENQRKICGCEKGFLKNDGKCQECNCGDHGTCRFEKGKKKCDCDPGAVERNGKCTDCICAGGTCEKEDGKKVCKCPPGYGNFTNISCKACDCGPDTNCIWEARFGGSKICLCKPGYSTKKGKCEICDCGPDSNCEWISEGWLKPEKKLCHCKMRFHEENGKCVGKQYFPN